MKDPDYYLDLYVKSDTFFLEGVIESFCNKYIERYEIDSVVYFSTRISMVSVLKKVKIRFRIII